MFGYPGHLFSLPPPAGVFTFFCFLDHATTSPKTLTHTQEIPVEAPPKDITWVKWSQMSNECNMYHCPLALLSFFFPFTVVVLFPSFLFFYYSLSLLWRYFFLSTYSGVLVLHMFRPARIHRARHCMIKSPVFATCISVMWLVSTEFVSLGESIGSDTGCARCRLDGWKYEFNAKKTHAHCC